MTAGAPAQTSVAAGSVQRLVASGGVTIQRKAVTIEGEQVEVSFWSQAKETKEAKAIIADIKATYGIELNSPRVIEGLKTQYANVPDSVKDALKTRKWHMKELRALAAAMKYFAPILGGERAKSTRSGADQEVTAVGKAEASIDVNTSAGKLDPDTLGEYFKAKKVMALFKSHEGVKIDFSNEKDQLVSTFIHETAHGLLAYAYDDLVQATDGYWTDQNTKSGKTGAEAPITDYGATNAREDLCETAKFYFVAPDRLKNGDGAANGKPGNPAPKRYAFMEKLGKSWVPPLKDAPQVAPSDGQATGTPVPSQGATPVLSGAD